MGAQVAPPRSLSLSNTHTHTGEEIQIYNTLFLIEPFWTEVRATGFYMITSQKHLPHSRLVLLTSASAGGSVSHS